MRPITHNSLWGALSVEYDSDWIKWNYFQGSLLSWLRPRLLEVRRWEVSIQIPLAKTAFRVLQVLARTLTTTFAIHIRTLAVLALPIQSSAFRKPFTLNVGTAKVVSRQDPARTPSSSSAGRNFPTEVVRLARTIVARNRLSLWTITSLSQLTLSLPLSTSLTGTATAILTLPLLTLQADLKIWTRDGLGKEFVAQNYAWIILQVLTHHFCAYIVTFEQLGCCWCPCWTEYCCYLWRTKRWNWRPSIVGNQMCSWLLYWQSAYC